MDHLWTPWRYRYVSALEEDGGARATCVFCRILSSSRCDRESLIVHRGERNFVILNRYPYTSGHMLVIPYAHHATLGEASERTAAEMVRLTRILERMLFDLYSPDGVNIGMNIGRAAGAGVCGHIHMHVLPRWTGDSSFVAVVGETRVLPEALAQTWDRAREWFGRQPV